MIQAIGILGMNMNDFLGTEPLFVIRTIKAKQEYLKMEHFSSYIATRNAIGQMISSKYKYYDMFEEEKQKEYTEEEAEDIKAELLGKKRGDN